MNPIRTPTPREQLEAAIAATKRKRPGQSSAKANWTRDNRGRNHPSKEEADWFNGLYADETRGVLVIEEIEPSFEITMQDKRTGNVRHVCNVKADARVRMIATGVVRVIDYKGRKGDTAVSRLKHKLVLFQHGVAIELVGKYVERKAKAKAKRAQERDLLKRSTK